MTAENKKFHCVINLFLKMNKSEMSFFIASLFRT